LEAGKVTAASRRAIDERESLVEFR
jgi:hypothetical protein